jgi:hypothetical protein
MSRCEGLMRPPGTRGMSVLPARRVKQFLRWGQLSLRLARKEGKGTRARRGPRTCQRVLDNCWVRCVKGRRESRKARPSKVSCATTRKKALHTSLARRLAQKQTDEGSGSIPHGGVGGAVSLSGLPEADTDPWRSGSVPLGVLCGAGWPSGRPEADTDQSESGSVPFGFGRRAVSPTVGPEGGGQSPSGSTGTGPTSLAEGAKNQEAKKRTIVWFGYERRLGSRAAARSPQWLPLMVGRNFPLRLSTAAGKSKHEHVPKVPLRMIVLAPNGPGTPVLLSNLTLNIDRGCFECIVVFNPSIDIDKTWEPGLTKNQSDDVKAIEKDTENLYSNHYDPASLEHIIGKQPKVIKMMKASNRRKLFSILIVIDDLPTMRFSPVSQNCCARFTRGDAQQHKHHCSNTEVCGDSPYQ